MKQKTMKLMAIFLGLVSVSFLPSALWADVASENRVPQRQGNNTDDLSWPKARLLEPSLQWNHKTGTFYQALGIGPLDSLHSTELRPTNVNYVRGVDVPGEWFVAIISTDSTSSGVAADYDVILKGTGYSQSVAVPEKRVILGFYNPQGRESRTANNELPYSVLGSYIKRKGLNVRLIVITSEPNINPRIFPPESGRRVDVFAGNIISVEQLLKPRSESQGRMNSSEN